MRDVRVCCALCRPVMPIAPLHIDTQPSGEHLRKSLQELNTSLLNSVRSASKCFGDKLAVLLLWRFRRLL